MLSEVYRNIRPPSFSLSLKDPQEPGHSQPSPMERKDHHSGQYGDCLSQLGSPVPIVDGDMRKPRIHKVFSGSNGVGLFKFSFRNAELNDY
jgi:hypothetical protein